MFAFCYLYFSTPLIKSLCKVIYKGHSQVMTTIFVIQKCVTLSTVLLKCSCQLLFHIFAQKCYMDELFSEHLCLCPLCLLPLLCINWQVSTASWHYQLIRTFWKLSAETTAPICDHTSQGSNHKKSQKHVFVT